MRRWRVVVREDGYRDEVAVVLTRAWSPAQLTVARVSVRGEYDFESALAEAVALGRQRAMFLNSTSRRASRRLP